MNKDLKIRIPTAILYVVVIVACLVSGTYSSVALISILGALCYFEFSKHSIPNENKGLRWIDHGIFIVFLGASITQIFNHLFWFYLTIFTVLFFLANGLFIIFKARNIFQSWDFLFKSFILLCLPFAITLHMIVSFDGYAFLLLFLFILIWLNDAGAYFAGKAFGKHKLHMKISPNKTWEGFFGGGILTIITGVIISRFNLDYPLELWLVLALLVWIFSVMGDLAESSWKRTLKIKDTGTLLPGHGGFLDRLDSFIYCSPLLALIVHYLY